MNTALPAPGAKLSEDGRNVNHNTFGYTGELWDEEDDLLYLRSRYYAPKVGRFMTRDAFSGFMSNPLSMHKYAYVENSPVNYVDPLGFNKKEAGKGSVVQPPNPKDLYKAPNPKELYNGPVKISNLDALIKGVSGLTDIPEIVSLGVQQSWNDPDVRQGTKNAVVSVVARSPLGPFRIGYNWILGVPEFKADKETEDALLKTSIVRIGSPSTAVKVKNWVERIKRFFNKK
ncbi:MAG: hypothetical protein CVV03_04000 [Firmicutes bacterium HGW-Firmicutes-8]|nr:MAG: hypothetical protein CVV03_04000 [Firmicutes bacterium HGW-Firmicutes-8]